jgi:hypothetical protein
LTGPFKRYFLIFFVGGAGKLVGAGRTLGIRYLEKIGSAEKCPFLIVTCS